MEDAIGENKNLMGHFIRKQERMNFDITDEYISDIFLDRVYITIRSLVLVNLFSIWSGFYLYYDHLDFYFKVDNKITLLGQEGDRTCKFFLLFGQIFFIFFSGFSLYLYRGSQLWKWVGIFFGIILCISAVTTLKYTLSTSGSACGTRCVSGKILYLVQNGVSILLFDLSVWRMKNFENLGKFFLILGGWMFQIVFPLVCYRDKYAGKSVLIFGLVFSIMAVAIILRKPNAC